MSNLSELEQQEFDRMVAGAFNTILKNNPSWSKVRVERQATWWATKQMNLKNFNKPREQPQKRTMGVGTLLSTLNHPIDLLTSDPSLPVDDVVNRYLVDEAGIKLPVYKEARDLIITVAAFNHKNKCKLQFTETK